MLNKKEIILFVLISIMGLVINKYVLFLIIISILFYISKKEFFLNLKKDYFDELYLEAMNLIEDKNKEIKSYNEKNNKVLSYFSSQVNYLLEENKKASEKTNLNRKIIDEIKKIKKERDELINKELSEINEIKNKIKELKLEIDVITDNKKEINKINEIIKEMNLVALNSKIEAARMGDFGNGFSVISDRFSFLNKEIKKIAEEIELNKGNTTINKKIANINVVNEYIDKIIKEIEKNNLDFDNKYNCLINNFFENLRKSEIKKVDINKNDKIKEINAIKIINIEKIKKEKNDFNAKEDNIKVLDFN